MKALWKFLRDVLVCEVVLAALFVGWVYLSSLYSLREFQMELLVFGYLVTAVLLFNAYVFGKNHNLFAIPVSFSLLPFLYLIISGGWRDWWLFLLVILISVYYVGPFLFITLVISGIMEHRKQKKMDKSQEAEDD
ncbi:MAG: hypothetical protein FWE80_06210 [Oscillospiraceae bacterium]|nr:hypothetical protein [Oscillospiraceae bacterium]